MSILTAFTPRKRPYNVRRYALAYTLAAGLVLGFAAVPAYATGATNERMPSNWELSEPGAETGAAAATTDAPAAATTTSADAQTPPVNAPAPSAARNTAANDPCPSPRVAKSNRPDDLAQVQEDIDRFSLCVQRAQLLERLNESAERATQTVDSALGFAPPAASAALPTGGRGMMPPLPAGAMGYDVSPTPPAATAPQRAGSTSSNSTTSAPQNRTDSQEVREEAPAPVQPKWVIREIFGSVTDMQARLLSAEGSEVLARQGTRLPDNTVITTITPSGVTVREDGAVKSLDWSGN